MLSPAHLKLLGATLLLVTSSACSVQVNTASCEDADCSCDDDANCEPEPEPEPTCPLDCARPGDPEECGAPCEESECTLPSDLADLELGTGSRTDDHVLLLGLGRVRTPRPPESEREPRSTKHVPSSHAPVAPVRADRGALAETAAPRRHLGDAAEPW
jgi:hypothetical protein